MSQPWYEARPVAELLEPAELPKGSIPGIYLVGWYDSPQIVRASLSIFFGGLHDGTTHEWIALLPDEGGKNGTAHLITPDVYWPCPTNYEWPRKPA